MAPGEADGEEDKGLENETQRQRLGWVGCVAALAPYSGVHRRPHS